jgi:H+/Cl- antiporter ClcA
MPVLTAVQCQQALQSCQVGICAGASHPHHAMLLLLLLLLLLLCLLAFCVQAYSPLAKASKLKDPTAEAIAKRLNKTTAQVYGGRLHCLLHNHGPSLSAAIAMHQL